MKIKANFAELIKAKSSSLDYPFRDSHELGVICLKCVPGWRERQKSNKHSSTNLLNQGGQMVPSINTSTFWGQVQGSPGGPIWSCAFLSWERLDQAQDSLLKG